MPDLPFRERPVEVNGITQIIRTIDNPPESAFCLQLDEHGRCRIHGRHPMPCDLEPIKVIFYRDSQTPNRLTQQLRGRGWRLEQVTGQRGTRCSFLPVDDDTVEEVVRRLERLKVWADAFELDTWLNAVIRWAREPSLRNTPMICCPRLHAYLEGLANEFDA